MPWQLSLLQHILTSSFYFVQDQHQPPYDGRLLALSLDLGERLMPAFDTRTSIPYGTVNLRYGVPRGETKIASTAGAGSLLLEFQVCE